MGWNNVHTTLLLVRKWLNMLAYYLLDYSIQSLSDMEFLGYNIGME